jgi:hypothetical protein
MSTSKRRASKSRQMQRGPKKLPLVLVLAGAAILIISVFLAFSPKQGSFTPEVTGSPRLKTDKEKVDLGDVQLGRPVQVTFEIKNAGDQSLIFTEAPYIEVKEGC